MILLHILQSNVVHPLTHLFLQHLHLHPLWLFVIIVEIEDCPVTLEIKHFLKVKNVDDSQLMHIASSFVLLCLEGFVFDDFEDGPQVISEVSLEDLFVELGGRIVDDFLCLRIKGFYLVSDSSVNVLIKYLKNIVFLPDIYLDICEIFLTLKLFPKLKVFDLLVLHEFFELDKKLK